MGLYGQAATGLTTAEMKHSSGFENWDFSGNWSIREGETYPALYSVFNNAPFAFADSITAKTSVPLMLLLANDYDYEMNQSNLVITSYSIHYTKLYEI